MSFAGGGTKRRILLQHGHLAHSAYNWQATTSVLVSIMSPSAPVAGNSHVPDLEINTTLDGKYSSNDHSNVTIDVAGDLLLQIDDSSSGLNFCYRVSSTVLRRASSYFDTLLHPDKFNEGATFASRQAQLRDQYGEAFPFPNDDLPVIHIADIGPLFPLNTPNMHVLARFFNVLHQKESFHLPAGVPSATHMALLAAVADRFDAIRAVSDYIVKKGWHTDMKEPNLRRIRRNTKNSVVKSKEIFWRQRILAGAILGVPGWVLHYGRLLIDSGSERWNVGTDQESTSMVDIATDGLWWDLPYGIEEELVYRRECILSTISSLQSHFLDLYSRPSKRPHCRLGYDSSPQCDSFQLGEMLRFFTRKGTVRLQSLISETTNEYTPSYSGSISALLASLRDCPTYQIDGHHSHCGLRTRFMPPLDHVTAMLASAEQVSVCMSCWRKHRSEHSWQERTLKVWHFRSDLSWLAIASECGSRHNLGRDMFTAEKRDWTPGV